MAKGAVYKRWLEQTFVTEIIFLQLIKRIQIVSAPMQ